MGREVGADDLGVFKPQLRTGRSQLSFQEVRDELATSFRDRRKTEAECFGLCLAGWLWLQSQNLMVYLPAKKPLRTPLIVSCAVPSIYL